MLGIGLGSQPTTECGIFGSFQSLELNGNSGYVTLPSGLIAAANPNSGTISCWINIRENDASDNQNIIRIVDDSTNNGMTLQYHKNNTEFRAVYRLNGVYKEATYNNLALDHAGYMALGWLHLAMTWESDGETGEVKIYHNGSLKETVAQNNSWGEDVIDIAIIGSNDDISGGFYDGYIDQIAIYDTVKNDNQLSAIYNGGVMTDLSTFYYSESARGTYTPSGLIGYYQFEGNALDSSGNNYHGTLNGVAGFNTSQP